MNENIILKHLNLLLVDDNRHIHAELNALFSTIFKSISLAYDAESALEMFATDSFDVVITDIEMPGIDGLSLIEKIRARNCEIPVIVLSAYTDKEYLFRAANLQIDGYITKPLSFKKLEPVLKRVAARLERLIKEIAISDEITYQPLFKLLFVDGEEVSLGGKECQLLELLLSNTHRVIGKPEISKTIWPNELVTESALKNLLGELRKKLKYSVICNHPGRGWVLMTKSA
ncbi:hypothetical protein BOW53_00905 [Solemya pervernicosa gill symbiont]|uniref:Response regulatory domain-containing protein n=2 Tax=Gammaproteobacteria incertae sedis TaxID=118884 RepID=A0A1T2LAS6_9GAMM|nr:response regulator transcription factor [Candidatus Reidiella endopervernicosa]OOZ42170.1 hypothetical protein BOW53_00905 [Solemya pervernicosa gill symbiont]QKQ27262.1 response regulator transcription factor [Candidatus Reidiella endopervernicosa]